MPESQDPARPEVRVTVSSIAAAGGPVPELRLWGIRQSIAVAVAAALVLVGSLVAAALWYAGWPGIERDTTVTASTLFDLLKLVFAVVAGIGGVAALVVAYRRQRVAEHTNTLAEFNHQLAHAADLRAEVTKALAEAADERAKIETDRNGVRLFNERFASASEQLGSDKAAVRLAGVYAMAGLADDWREGRQTCIDVLCAYLRMPPTLLAETLDETPVQADDQFSAVNMELERAAREEREVRLTVIRLVVRHLRLAEEEAASWRGYDFDFTGAVFDGGDFDFSRVTFSGGVVSFSQATFSGGWVSFDEATFSGGKVSFAEAAFGGGEVSFDGATFSGGEVSFFMAKFADGHVSFYKATFGGGEVSFFGAKFSGAVVQFPFVAFNGGYVMFHRATFSGGDMNFRRATFSGGEVSFSDATFSGGAVSFCGAAFSGGAISFDTADFQVPPEFDDWTEDLPPAGLVLPGE